MGMVNGGTISRVEESVVVDQVANFARKLEEGKRGLALGGLVSMMSQSV